MMRRIWTAFRQLHLLLYGLFFVMIGLGGIVASVFEQYSIIDFDRMLGELKLLTQATARGDQPKDDSRLREALRPLDENAREAKRAGGARDRNVKINLGGAPTRWMTLFIVAWLWPLYRHYFSHRKANLVRVEQRIIDLPLFLFGLTWLVTALRYFDKISLYRDLYGEPDLRIVSTFAASAILLGTLGGYLNLEVTRLYDHVGAAVRAAVGMRAALAEFNLTGVYPHVQAGVGVHAGPLVAGNVGTDERAEYTVLGDTVNVAARIEGQTKEQRADILVSDVVVALLGPEDRAAIPVQSCGPILLKGKSAPMELYRVE